jgi:DNA-binding LacI/PurR family transcriptional regulator
MNPSTIHDVARKANVAASTVSRVLNARGGSIPISEETCERVRQIAAEMNYVPNKLARFFRHGRTNLLSLILPWNVPELMDVAERTAHEAGYRLMVQFTPTPDRETEIRSLTIAMEQRVDGIIWLPTGASEEYTKILQQLRAVRTPVVLLEAQKEQYPQEMIIDFDYQAGYRLGVEHLVRQGYKTLIYVTYQTAKYATNREGYFCDAAAELHAESSLWVMTSPEDIDASISAKLQSSQYPVGFICENDWVGISVLRSLQRHAINIPKDAGVMMIGDILVGTQFHLSELSNPRMTSVVRPFGQMARRAVQVLEQKIKSPAVASFSHEQLSMPLVARESTAHV